MEALPQELHDLLAHPELDLEAVLEHSMRWFSVQLGTLHVWDPAAQLLRLRAAHGLPEALRAAVMTIPIGKGMAGLAAERGAPVQVCNLQTDRSGAARPGAKASGMEGSLAVPMISASGMLRGVLGLARATL
jgi:L-methionine (R)-S-oxide reductase